MKWQDLLDHLITVEGECMEEFYGKGRALNEADEECAAGIRQGYAELLKVRSVLMAAPELLAVCQAMAGDLQALLDGDDFSGMSDAEMFGVMLRSLNAAIAKAEGRSE